VHVQAVVGRMRGGSYARRSALSGILDTRKQRDEKPWTRSVDKLGKEGTTGVYTNNIHTQ
jgi:hypothetical protein